MDPYKILGISRDASKDEIKRAYREKAAKYHPDSGGELWVFQQIQEAYRELTEPKQKKAKRDKPKPPPPHYDFENASRRRESTGSFDARSTGYTSSTRRSKNRKSSSRTTIIHAIGILGGGLSALLVAGLFYLFLQSLRSNEQVVRRESPADPRTNSEKAHDIKSRQDQSPEPEQRAPIQPQLDPAPRIAPPNNDPPNDDPLVDDNAMDLNVVPNAIVDADIVPPVIDFPESQLLTSSGIKMNHLGIFRPFVIGEQLWGNREHTWIRLADHRAKWQFWKHDKSHQARTAFNVQKPGIVIVAFMFRPPDVNLDGGAWESEVITREQLEKDGWVFTGNIVSDRENLQDVWHLYYRNCAEGDAFSFRTDKYLAPVLVLRQPRERYLTQYWRDFQHLVEDVNAFLSDIQPEDLAGALKDADAFSISELVLPVRKWRDRSGTFDVRARLVDQTEDHIVLATREGKTLEVPWSELSDVDRKYMTDIQKKIFAAAERNLLFADKILRFYQDELLNGGHQEDIKDQIQARMNVIAELGKQAVLVGSEFQTLEKIESNRQLANDKIEEWAELVSDKKDRQAEEAIRAAIRDDQVSIRALYYFAYSYLHQLDFETAEFNFERVVERGRRYREIQGEEEYANIASAINNLALLKIRRNQTTEAKNLWASISEFSPMSGEVIHNIHRVQLMMKKSLDDSTPYLIVDGRKYKDWQSWMREMEMPEWNNRHGRESGWVYLPYLVDGQEDFTVRSAIEGRTFSPERVMRGIEDIACMICDGTDIRECPRNDCIKGAITVRGSSTGSDSSGNFQTTIGVKKKKKCPDCDGVGAIKCPFCYRGRQRF